MQISNRNMILVCCIFIILYFNPYIISDGSTTPFVQRKYKNRKGKDK